MSTDRAERSGAPARVMVDATGLGTLGSDIDSDLIELVKAAGRVRDDIVVVCKPRDAKLFKSFDLDVHRAPDSVKSERSRRWWIDWSLPKLARSVGADVIHSPHGYFPAFTRLGRVVAVRWGTGASDRLRRILPTFKVDVTVPSTAIGEELRAIAGLPANRVHRAPLGVDKDRTSIPDWEAIQAAGDLYGVSEWVVVIGTDSRLDDLTAFRDGFRQATEFSGLRPTLIVLGVSERKALAVFTDMIDVGFDIRIVSGIANDERSAVIGGSILTVVTDDSDATGRALIDVMACGATTLAIQNPALVEIGGEAVDFADATPAAMEIALTGLLKNEERRRELATAAVTRSHRFSWEQSLVAHRAAWARAAARL
ncbi:MAG: glycosyltransferase [Microbacteriaceae bacterium]